MRPRRDFSYLRAYYAGLAMQGLLSAGSPTMKSLLTESIAVADEMIKQLYADGIK